MNKEFTKDQSTFDKHLVRASVAQEVRRLLRSNALDGSQPHIAILPGNEPKHEIEIYKELTNAYITAIDRNKNAVEAARRDGADIAIEGDVSTIVEHLDNLNNRKTILSSNKRKSIEKFDYFSLDCCSPVSEWGMADTVENAMYISKFLTTWCSYGRETDRGGRASSKEIEEFGARQLGGNPILREFFGNVRNTICHRIIYLWDIVIKAARERRGNIEHVTRLQPVKIWRYIGTYPMFVVLWTPYDKMVVEKAIYEEIGCVKVDKPKTLTTEDCQAILKLRENGTMIPFLTEPKLTKSIPSRLTIRI